MKKKKRTIQLSFTSNQNPIIIYIVKMVSVETIVFVESIESNDLDLANGLPGFVGLEGGEIAPLNSSKVIQWNLIYKLNNRVEKNNLIILGTMYATEPELKLQMLMSSWTVSMHGILKIWKKKLC